MVDDYTFRVTYEKPFAPALQSWAIGILPRHLLEGKDVDIIAGQKTDRNWPIPIKEWIPSDLVLTANDDYFEGKPYIERRITRVIPDLATMFLELKRYSLDMMGLTPMQALKQTDYPGFKRNLININISAFLTFISATI